MRLMHLKAVLFLIFLSIAPSATAITIPPDLMGTIRVSYSPMQQQGKLLGCSLIFDATVVDEVYELGAPLKVSGNITFFGNSKGAIVGLKLGVINLNNKKVQAPYFAYMQTPKASTSKIKYSTGESDRPGFKLFFYPLEDEMLKVFEEMTNSDAITIGFNLKKDGLDILVPIDLSIKDTTVDKSPVQKVRSKEMVTQFLECSSKVATSVAESLE